jgi:hypothetical protein
MQKVICSDLDNCLLQLPRLLLQAALGLLMDPDQMVAVVMMSDHMMHIGEVDGQGRMGADQGAKRGRESNGT